MASGATRAALTKHFAVADNLADVAAKEHSQVWTAALWYIALEILCAASRCVVRKLDNQLFLLSRVTPTCLLCMCCCHGALEGVVVVGGLP